MDVFDVRNVVKEPDALLAVTENPGIARFC